MSVWWSVAACSLSFYAGALAVSLMVAAGRRPPRGGYVPRDVLRRTSPGTDQIRPLVATSTGCSPDGPLRAERERQAKQAAQNKLTELGYSGTATDGHRGAPATPAGFRSFNDVIRMPTSTMDEKLAKAQAFADALDAKRGTAGWGGAA